MITDEKRIGKLKDEAKRISQNIAEKDKKKVK